MSLRRSLGMFARVGLVVCSALLMFGAAAHAAPQSGTFKIVRRMPVGGDGGWDYLRVDPDAHRIYLSRGTHMMVVDEVSGKVIGDIPETMGIHGVALAFDLGKGYTSNGGEDTVTVFDLKTLKPAMKIKTTGGIQTRSSMIR